MAEQKTMPLTTSVKNYLLQCIAKAGTEPERLLSEMELCSKFGVSRITVRRAIQSLEKIDYIIRIPGRQGAFTNPKIAMAVPHIVGILCGDGTRNYVNSLTAEILTGFMNEMKCIDCDFEFMLLNINGDQNAAQAIENMALDGLLWIMPEENIVGQIDLLIEKEYPVVTLDSIYNSYAQRPVKNTISRDFERGGIMYAELMIKHHHRNVPLLGAYNSSAQGFHNEMRKNGIHLPREFFIETPEEVTEKLPALLASQKVDAIICNGGLTRYERTLHVLQLRENWKKIPVYMDNRNLERKLKKNFPELKIELILEDHFFKAYGQTAGRYMKKLIAGEIKSFESIKIPPQKKEK